MLIGTVSAVLIALVILFLISAYMRLSHIWTASCHAHHLEAAFFHYFDIAQFPEGDLPVEQYLAKMSDTEREIAKQLTIRIHRKGAFVTFTITNKKDKKTVFQSTWDISSPHACANPFPDDCMEAGGQLPK